MTPQQVEKIIQTGLPDAQVSVMSEDDTHFEAVVISSQFVDKRPLQRHQMVYRHSVN